MSNSGKNYSVYHRAKLLSPVFPWLLFVHVFPPSSHLLPLPVAAAADPPLNSKSSLPSSLRGHIHHSQHRQPLPFHDGQRKLPRTVQNYCGKTWNDANGSCLRPCPDGESTLCGAGEQCFADLISCPSMTVLDPWESGESPPQPQTLGEAAAADAGFGGAAVAGNNNDATAGTSLHTNTAVGGSASTTSTVGATLPFQIGATVPTSCASATTNTINVGYYQSWAKYRQPHCHPQQASEIPVSAFGYTHLIYSFAGISAAGQLEPYNGIMDETTLYQELNELKASNPGLKTLIAVGGWNLDQTLFGRAASSPATRLTFSQSVADFVQQYNFDGLDLDWEYPVSRQGTPADYDNYPLLVQAIREALDTVSQQSNKDYLLTMAIPVNPEKLDAGFNLGELSKYLNWFHLMSYDIHGSWDEIAGSNTDLEYISNAVENSILNRGVPPDQLVFGMASYGRSMLLKDPSCKTVGCPINGAGFEGCSGEAGFSPYFELKENYVDSGAYDSLLINERTGSMEMIVEGNIFVSLDVDVTFEMKRDYYLSKCFRGQMWWAIDMIKDPPFSTNQVSTNAQATSTNNIPSPTPPTIASPPTVSINSAPGVTQDDAYCSGTSGAELAPIEDCAGFVFCQNGRMSGSLTMCSPGLLFDANMGICNWPSDTNICGFEFCPNKMSGYVPFEDCQKFYYCKVGNIDGDIDVCPEGTLFDVELGLCNWASMVVCATMRPTPAPTAKMSPNPTFVAVASTPSVAAAASPDRTAYGVVEQAGLPTPRPMYGKVGGGGTAINNNKPASPPSDANGLAGIPGQVAIAGSNPDGTNPSVFQDNTARLTFIPTDDAYVQFEKPRQNFNDRFVVVDNNQRFDGLLRFYVQGLDGRRVKYVKLRLYVVNQSRFGGNFYKCKDNWHEDVVTWDSVPSIIGNKPLAIVNAVLLDEWIEVDVTNLVNQDGPVSIRITSDSEDNVMYSSKENLNGNAPELIVGVETISTSTYDEGGDIEARASPTVSNTVKIGPTDDAFVFHDTARENYGRHEDLKVDLDSGATSYLRFDFSRVQVDAIESAKLRLYATNSSLSGGLFVTVTDSNWNEDTITFENAPPADGVVLGTLEDVAAGTWYELDVTKEITESGPLTICILGGHEDGVAYSSKDGPHSPEILLTLLQSVPLVSQSGKVVELIPTDDAMIDLSNPDSKFGTSKALTADSHDGMRNFLLRFDATNIPQGEVKSAILRLYATNEEPAYGGTFVEAGNSDWTEQTVTWKTAPLSDGKVLGSLMEVEYGSWYDLDVTMAVIGGSPVTIRVSSPHSIAAVYSSKESGVHQPKLIVQYSPPPPLPEDFDVYIPTDDASILMEKPTANFGRDDRLRVDGYGGVYNSLLRFDLSSVEKGTVDQAILRLYAVDGSPSGGTFVVTSNTEWSQYKVTWFSAPAADGVILETLGEVVPYQWYEIDLAQIAQDLGGEPLSIRIAPSHGFRCAYSSSEDRLGHLPQLMIKADLFKGIE